MARRDNNHQKISAGGRNRKSNDRKRQTGLWPADPGTLGEDRRLDRKANSEYAPELQSFHANKRTFNIVVDNTPYLIEAIPFRFNGEARYNVSFNGSPEHVFTWDSSLGQLRAIDDDSSTMPDNLEMAISDKLQSMK